MTMEEIQRLIGALTIDACATFAKTDAVYSDLRKRLTDADIQNMKLKDEADFWHRAYNDVVADFNDLSEKYEALKENSCADGGKAGVK